MDCGKLVGHCGETGFVFRDYLHLLLVLVVCGGGGAGIDVILKFLLQFLAFFAELVILAVIGEQLVVHSLGLVHGRIIAIATIFPQYPKTTNNIATNPIIPIFMTLNTLATPGLIFFNLQLINLSIFSRNNIGKWVYFFLKLRDVAIDFGILFLHGFDGVLAGAVDLAEFFEVAGQFHVVVVPDVGSLALFFLF